jgi:hypothetical protein
MSVQEMLADDIKACLAFAADRERRKPCGPLDGGL